MKYGVYEERHPGACLYTTSINLDRAMEAADAASRNCEGSFIVVQLGPETPDFVYYADRFFPRLLYRSPDTSKGLRFVKALDKYSPRV